MKKFTFFIVIMIACIFCSCQKEKAEQKVKNIVQEQTEKMPEPETNEQIVEEKGKNESVSEKIQIVPDKDNDDSEFDDPATIELCLKDDEERTFCLFHNIYKVKDFDAENYEVVAEWTTGEYSFRWCKQEKNDLSITWNYENGGIIRMETESPKYSTKRGIKVGDSLSNIMEAYGNDVEIYEYDYVNEKLNLISENKNALFSWYKSKNRVSLNAGNMLAETIMAMSFYLEDDFITKIVILCGD